jgi:hypothetical protein
MHGGIAPGGLLMGPIFPDFTWEAPSQLARGLISALPLMPPTGPIGGVSNQAKIGSFRP